MKFVKSGPSVYLGLLRELEEREGLDKVSTHQVLKLDTIESALKRCSDAVERENYLKNKVPSVYIYILRVFGRR